MKCLFIKCYDVLQNPESTVLLPSKQLYNLNFDLSETYNTVISPSARRRYVFSKPNPKT